MRLELDAMRCSVEDYQRQHNEELSVRLAAFDADRARLQAGTNSLREDVASLKDRLAATEASALPDAKKAIADEGLASSQIFEALRMSVRRLEESMEEERTARAQTMASAAAKSAGDSVAVAEMNARLQELQKSMESEHGSRTSEVTSLRRDMEDVAKEVLKMRDEEAKLRENMKVIERRLPDDGGASLAELAQLLQIECKSRKNDVEELHQQLRLTEAWISEKPTSAPTTEVQQTLTDLDMRVGRLVSALETERDLRKSDVDRYSAAVTDVMDALKAERMLRASELEKLRTALAQLTLNLQSALASETSESQVKIAAAFASLATALDKDVSSGDADKADDGTASPDKRVAAAELVAEVTTRVEILAASLRGELTAKAAELRGDLAATRAELLRKIEDNIGGGGDGAEGGGGPIGLQSSAALAGQLNEVVRLVQVIASGTEHLGEKLCDEVTDRRQSEVTVSNRISRVEHRLSELGGKDPNWAFPPSMTPMSEFFPEDPLLSPSEHATAPLSPGARHRSVPGFETPASTGRGTAPNPVQPYSEVLKQQTVVSESLKDSLEQLVTRVNRMLKPAQDGAGRRSPSRNRSTAQSREPSAQGLSGGLPGRMPAAQEAARPGLGNIATAKGAELAGSAQVPGGGPIQRHSTGPAARPCGPSTATRPGFPAGSYVGPAPGAARPAGPTMAPGPGQGPPPQGCRPMRPQVPIHVAQQHGKAPPYAMMGQARSLQVRPPGP